MKKWNSKKPILGPLNYVKPRDECLRNMNGDLLNNCVSSFVFMEDYYFCHGIDFYCISKIWIDILGP